MTSKQKVYASMANEQWTSEVKINAKRGRILDSEGNELAVSANVYRVDLDLNTLRSYMKKNKLSNDDISKALSEALDMEYNSILDKLDLKLSSGVPANSATLARQIEKDKADKVKQLNFSGVVISEDIKRYYPNNNFLSKVLGVVNSDGVGITGIEAYYNTYTPVEEEYVSSLAKQNALLLTGGTDFHGQNKPHISLFTGQGNMEVPEAILPEFMEAIGFTR